MSFHTLGGYNLYTVVNYIVDSFFNTLAYYDVDWSVG